jgi:hypothetical protein
VIKESCGCGATFEVIQGFVDREDQAVAIWRREHKHEPQTVARDVPRVQPEWAYDPDLYVLGEDYILNGDDEPVWISSTHSPPPFWRQWAENQRLNKPLKNLIEVKTDPSVYHPA